MKNFKHIKFLVVLALTVLLALTACSNTTKTNEDTKKTSASSDVQKTMPLPTKDRAGNTIEIPKDAKKIVSLAPATSQILEDLGLLDKVIAIDNQTPIYISSLSSLPQYDMMSPDCESLLALEPDIVFVTGMTAIRSGDPFKTLKDNGVCVAEIPSSESITDIKTDIEFIADCFGMNKEGKAITATMQKEIDKISAIGKTIKHKKTVMFEIANAPNIYSFGKDVFLNEMLDIIGAKNVFADQKSWLAITEESAVSSNPDVILTSVNYIDKPVDEILARASFSDVSAIKNKQVYYIDNASCTLPNQHIITALKQMAKAVYKDEYKDIN